MTYRRDLEILLAVIIAAGLVLAATAAHWMGQQSGFVPSILILWLTVLLADSIAHQMTGNAFRPGFATLLFTGLLVALYGIGPAPTGNYLGAMLPCLGAAGWLAVRTPRTPPRHTIPPATGGTR